MPIHVAESIFVLSGCLVVVLSKRKFVFGQTKRTATKNRRRNYLPVRLFPQETNYSCTASVLMTLVHAITGETLSHEQAIRATRCRPNGAPLENISKALKRSCRARSTPLRNLAAARRALQAGRLVISHDKITYRPDDHAILLAGATKKGFYVVDPNCDRIKWRREDRMKEAANEFIAVFLPDSPQKRLKPARKHQKAAEMEK